MSVSTRIPTWPRRDQQRPTAFNGNSMRILPRLFITALLSLLAAIRVDAASVGFQVIRVPVPEDVPLEVAIWYPSKTRPIARRLGPFTQTVARNGAIAGRSLPLVVISHGTAEWYGALYDTAIALARAGFVVAAPTHTGDNLADRSRSIRLADRPLHIHLVINDLLESWQYHRHIDAGRVGMFGFSAGALTALIVAGGEPDLGTLEDHCRDHPDFFDCRLVRAHASASPPPATPSLVHDARVKAIVVAAPALGFTFSPDGLKAVTLPVQLWRAANDHVLPSPFYAEAVRDSLPSPPEYHVVAGADHLDFLAVCSPKWRSAAPDLCVERDGFDRGHFHREFNKRVVAFFSRTLKPIS